MSTITQVLDLISTVKGQNISSWNVNMGCISHKCVFTINIVPVKMSTFKLHSTHFYV